MSSLASTYGAEINELLAELKRITVPAPTNAAWLQIRDLQRRVDGLASSLLLAIRRRAALVRDRGWVETDIHGFERALVLVGRTGTDDGASHGSVRLERRLKAQMACVDELAHEFEAMDQRIRGIESDIVATHQELTVVLRGSITDAEQKIRAAKLARLHRKSQAHRAILSFDHVPLWSPHAVMGFRV